MAFSGSTIEPVISHSSDERQPGERGQREREPAGDRGLLVDELGRRAGHGDGERRVGAPDLVHQRAGLLAHGVAGGLDVQAQCPRRGTAPARR